ncbi:MAG: hypothetical protein ACWA6X_00595 [Bauldia sp.]
MIPTFVLPYRNGELRIGWASWDDGRFTERSIKWAYRDKSGKISRGSPEVPLDVLLDMLLVAYSQGEVDHLSSQRAASAKVNLADFSRSELELERRDLTQALASLQAILARFPSTKAHMAPVYDGLGARLDLVKALTAASV